MENKYMDAKGISHTAKGLGNRAARSLELMRKFLREESERELQEPVSRQLRNLEKIKHFNRMVYEPTELYESN